MIILIEGVNKKITKVVTKININTKSPQIKQQIKFIEINIIKTNKGYQIDQKDYIEKMLIKNIIYNI